MPNLSTSPNFRPTPPPLDQATIEPDPAGDAGPEADEAATDDAIAALSPAELDALDAEIAAGLSPATLTRLRDRPAQLARLRRIAWRRRDSAKRANDEPVAKDQPDEEA